MTDRRYQLAPTIPTGYILDPCRGMFSVVVPQTAINLVTNPSFENGVTGYGGWGAVSTGTPSVNRYFYSEVGFGRYGGYGAIVGARAIFLPNPESGGISYSIELTQDVTYTGSMWIKAAGFVSISDRSTIPRNASIYFRTIGGTPLSAVIPIKVTNIWQRFCVTFTPSATDTYNLYLKLGDDLVLGDSRRVRTDGWQIETGPVATSYVDGDLIPSAPHGYSWGGAANETFSFRGAFERSGGLIVPLKRYGVEVERIAGLGASPYATIGEDYALLAGGQYQRSRPTTRDFSLVCRLTGDWYQWLHSDRNALIQALNPDRVTPQQPLILLYQEFDNATGNAISPQLEIPCVYVSGLEGDIAARTGEPLALTFRMYDPYLRSGTDAATITVDETLAVNYIARRRVDTGDWANLATGADAAIYDLQFFGGTYVCGDFSNIGSPVVTTDRVAYWDGNMWISVGNGLNAVCYTLARSPSGRVYVGGTFTQDGAANTVRKIASLATPTANWTALDNTELNNVDANGVRKLIFDRDGGLLVAATWTGGTVGAGELGYYSNAGAWSGLASSTWTDGIIRDIAYSPDGRTPYVCGSFTTIGLPADLAATTVNYVARYYNGAWESLGSGMNGAVYRIAFDRQGRLIAVGNFTTAGGNACRRIAAWNGTDWFEVGNGFDAQADVLHISPVGGLYVGGSFTADGDNENQLPSGLAFFNGGRWQPLELDLGATGYPTAIGVSPVGNLWVATDTAVSANAATTSTVTVIGTAPTPPTIMFTNDSGSTQRIYSVNNWSARQFLSLQTDILDGETITVVCGYNPSITSDTRPNLGSVILPVSNLAEFVLLPGENFITTLAPGCTAIMTWPVLFNGIEGMGV